MNLFPPMPPLEGLHPLVVHFPIAVLLVAPLFMIASLVFNAHRRSLVACSAAMLLIGSASIWFAVYTGEASEPNAVPFSSAQGVLEAHEETGELARNIFLGLTVAYLAGVGLPAMLLRDEKRAVRATIVVVYLIGHFVGAVVLANAAHEGGRLVHEFGVHAPIGSPATSPPPNTSIAPHDDD